MQANVVGFLNTHYSCAKKNETWEDLTLQRIVGDCFKQSFLPETDILSFCKQAGKMLS